MSKHPDNPYWCQQHDQPYSIDSADAWDAARLGGHLTTEHVLNRLKAMLEYRFGAGAEPGYDESGFLVALVADGWQLQGGVSVHLYPNDHPPPHVHVRFRAAPRLHLRLSIATGEPLDDAVPDGWAKKARKVTEFVLQSQDLLMGRWIEIHGAPAASG